MDDEFQHRCAALLKDLGLCEASGITGMTRLTGGVASDIAAVTFDDRAACLKFALSKLAVAEDWFAPVHRSRAEYAWLTVAGRAVPGSAPALLGYSDALQGFAMEYVTGPGVHLWKTALLDGAPDRGEAAGVGDVLGRIHAASTAPGFDAAAFDNADDFDALRLEPYLRFTATRHPDLAARLVAMADALKAGRVALVHGDVSPKNILVRGGGPMILDAECATMGDPAFDVAFCLNHLILKSFHMPGRADALLAMTGDFWTAYAPHVTWEGGAAIEARVAALLPMLMLARIDGKSPVEYLNAPTRDLVRTAAIGLIERPAGSLADLRTRLGRMTA